jgi:hypothetical protein
MQQLAAPSRFLLERQPVGQASTLLVFRRALKTLAGGHYPRSLYLNRFKYSFVALSRLKLRVKEQ